MRRTLIVVLVLLLVGQGRPSQARASGTQQRAAELNSTQALITPHVPEMLKPTRPQDSFWRRLWTVITARARALAAAFVRWVTTSLRQALSTIWERVRWEGDKIWRWVRGLWQWMNLRGDVGPIR